VDPQTSLLFQIAGEVFVIGVPTTSVIFIASRWFITKWLEHKFAERLETLKTEQAKALKHIQSSIDHQIHRAKKLYDTEFEVMTKSWTMLEELYGHVLDSRATAPIYSEWEAATTEQIREVLDAETDLTEDEKTQVVEADDPADEYRVVFDWRRAKVYEAASIAFGHYLGSNGIFMRRDIREKFRRLSMLITLTFSEFASNIRRNDRVNTHYLTLMIDGNEGKKVRNELRDLIEGRLWSATTTQVETV
jgi:hypothetical protein